MKAVSRLLVPLLTASLLLATAIMLLPLESEAAGPTTYPAQPTGIQTAQWPPLTPAGLGALAVDADGDVQLTPNGARSPDLALSTDNSFLAVVYQLGGAIRLRSTDGATGWIGFPPNLGPGRSPTLAFSDGNTVQVVWAGDLDKTIYHASCDVAATQATCTSAQKINTDAADTNDTIGGPVIVVSAPYIYVAWINVTDDLVRTARRLVSGGAWDFNSVSGTDLSGSTLALAAANNVVHLAYVHRDGGGNYTMRYRNSMEADHDWLNPQSFAEKANYTPISNPALAAVGTLVYLTWDNERDTTEPDDGMHPYALLGASSDDGGVSWDVDEAGEQPLFITSTNLIEDVTVDKRRTRDGVGVNATPSEEAGLRPSVAVTGTNEFIVVWQERPGSQCITTGDEETVVQNGTAEITFAEMAMPGDPLANWWDGPSGTLANNVHKYSIDPDIAVNLTNKERHIVFMKADAPSGLNACRAGGGASDYAIYYRGPFQTVQAPPGVFLPIIHNDD